MRRRSLTPREDWIRRVEDVGLIYHHTAEGVYWDETACWEFTIKEIEHIERVTADLHRLALRAAQYVIDTKRFEEFGIPPWVAVLIANAWVKEPPSLYGRMDLGYDGHDLTLLEYNADTPTALVEAAVAQWFWLQDVSPQADQFNSLHEKLIAKWRDLLAWSPVHFAHINQSEGEDLMTVTYLRETAEQAGIQTFGLAMEEIGRNGDFFVDVMVVDGVHSDQQDGEYGAEGYVYQAIALLTSERAILGSWLIDGVPAGMGFESHKPAAGSRRT